MRQGLFNLGLFKVLLAAGCRGSFDGLLSKTTERRRFLAEAALYFFLHYPGHPLCPTGLPAPISAPHLGAGGGGGSVPRGKRTGGGPE